MSSLRVPILVVPSPKFVDVGVAEGCGVLASTAPIPRAIEEFAEDGVR
jgi:hypothetical protein